MPLSRPVPFLQQTLMTNNVDRAPPPSPGPPSTINGFPAPFRVPGSRTVPLLTHLAPVPGGGTPALARAAPSLPLVSPRLVSCPTIKSYLDAGAASAAPSKPRPAPANSPDKPLRKEKKKKEEKNHVANLILQVQATTKLSRRRELAGGRTLPFLVSPTSSLGTRKYRQAFLFLPPNYPGLGTQAMNFSVTIT